MLNINKNLLLLIYVLFIVSVTSSCKKYLDKKSNDNLTIPTTLADAQALLDNTSGMNINTTPSYIETSSDDYFLLPDYYNALDTKLQNGYLWKPFDYNWPNDWASSYSVIYNANYCLETTANVDLNGANESLWNNVRGSALFFRSYYFLGLAWTHGKAYDESTAASDPGIVLRLESDFNVRSVRSNVKDTYDQLIKDAKEAASYLPDTSLHPVRPSKAAAYGLLARTYLSMRMYDSALKYADLSLKIKSKLINYGMTPCASCDVVSSISSGNPPFKKFNSETIFYSDMSSNVTAHYAYNGALVDSALYLSYSSNDLRRKAYFIATDGYQGYRGSYSQNLYIFFTGIATDEMYLTRAECYARKGEVNSALNDLNTLLANRHDASFVPLTAVDENDALNKILAERRKELLFRGLRWSDIKRLNLESRNISLKRIVNGESYTLQPNAGMYALPLPTDIITETGMGQNPL